MENAQKCFANHTSMPVAMCAANIMAMDVISAILKGDGLLLKIYYKKKDI